jgi:hypothetical protein
MASFGRDWQTCVPKVIAEVCSHPGGSLPDWVVTLLLDACGVALWLALGAEPVQSYRHAQGLFGLRVQPRSALPSPYPDFFRPGSEHRLLCTCLGGCITHRGHKYLARLHLVRVKEGSDVCYISARQWHRRARL